MLRARVYARVTMLRVDPAQLGKAVHYIEETVRPDFEAQRNSRGMACLVNLSSVPPTCPNRRLVGDHRRRCRVPVRVHRPHPR
jgi:hypothetical protein